MKCETSVSTGEIHRISLDPERPDFFTGVGEGILTVLLKSGVLALLKTRSFYTQCLSFLPKVAHQSFATNGVT